MHDIIVQLSYKGGPGSGGQAGFTSLTINITDRKSTMITRRDMHCLLPQIQTDRQKVTVMSLRYESALTFHERGEKTHSMGSDLKQNLIYLH